MDIPEIIKLHRKNKGLTQIELAKQSGVNRQSIGKIENGNYNILLSGFFKILDNIGLQPTITIKP